MKATCSVQARVMSSARVSEYESGQHWEPAKALWTGQSSELQREMKWGPATVTCSGPQRVLSSAHVSEYE